MISVWNSNAASALAEAEQHLADRDLITAINNFDVAETLGADPDRCSAGRWMASMFLGHFADAWRESDAIVKRGAPDPQRLWQGEDIRDKRLIVRCLHGFGDAVQFLRYAQALGHIARRVVFEVPPRLVELAPHFDGVDEVITWGAQPAVQAPTWDVQVEVMELPYVFRTELRDLPIAERYLHLPEEKVHQIERSFERPTVGLVWSAGVWNPARSIPIDLLAPLLAIEGCEFWNLQALPLAQPEIRQTEGLLRESPSCREGILPLACLISQLDLVITVDTLAAHLAGALGIQVWLLLQAAADWRWLANTNSSPWYASMRLFRQRRQGDWAFLISQVAMALRAWSLKSKKRLIA